MGLYALKAYQISKYRKIVTELYISDLRHHRVRFRVNGVIEWGGAVSSKATKTAKSSFGS